MERVFVVCFNETRKLFAASMLAACVFISFLFFSFFYLVKNHVSDTQWLKQFSVYASMGIKSTEFLFFLTHFLCSTHLLAIWLKEEPSKVSWLLSFHTFLLYTLNTIQYTRTDCSRNDIRIPSLPNVLAKKMSTYYIYPLHSSFFLSQLYQVSRYTQLSSDFFFVHIVENDELFALWNREILWTSFPMHCVIVYSWVTFIIWLSF